MFVRFLLVFDLLFILFRVALWPSAGKELSLWLFIFVVSGRMWNSIVSVPDHCLFIYCATRFNFGKTWKHSNLSQFIFPFFQTGVEVQPNTDRDTLSTSCLARSVLFSFYCDHLAWGRESWPVCFSCICLSCMRCFSRPPGVRGWFLTFLASGVYFLNACWLHVNKQGWISRKV